MIGFMRRSRERAQRVQERAETYREQGRCGTCGSPLPQGCPEESNDGMPSWFLALVVAILGTTLTVIFTR